MPAVASMAAGETNSITKTRDGRSRLQLEIPEEVA